MKRSERESFHLVVVAVADVVVAVVAVSFFVA